MARSSDMVRLPKRSTEETTSDSEGTACLLWLMPVISGTVALCCRSWGGWRSCLDTRLPVSDSCACCARRSSSGPPSLGYPHHQSRCVEWCHCLSRHLRRGGTRRHGWRNPLQFLGTGGPGRRRGGESCRPRLQSHRQFLGAGGPGCRRGGGSCHGSAQGHRPLLGAGGPGWRRAPDACGQRSTTWGRASRWWSGKRVRLPKADHLAHDERHALLLFLGTLSHLYPGHIYGEAVVWQLFPEAAGAEDYCCRRLSSQILVWHPGARVDAISLGGWCVEIAGKEAEMGCAGPC